MFLKQRLESESERLKPLYYLPSENKNVDLDMLKNCKSSLFEVFFKKIIFNFFVNFKKSIQYWERYK